MFQFREGGKEGSNAPPMGGRREHQNCHTPWPSPLALAPRLVRASVRGRTLANVQSTTLMHKNDVGGG